MRGIDILMSAPLFVLVMISQIVIKPSIWSLMIVIGLISWMDIARLCRAEFLNLRSSEFVSAATDRGNFPMAANFAKAGYPVVRERLNYRPLHTG